MNPPKIVPVPARLPSRGHSPPSSRHASSANLIADALLLNAPELHKSREPDKKRSSHPLPVPEKRSSHLKASRFGLTRSKRISTVGRSSGLTSEVYRGRVTLRFPQPANVPADIIAAAIRSCSVAPIAVTWRLVLSPSLLPGMMLALNTGLRYDELRLLTWRQVGRLRKRVGDGRQEPCAE